MAENEQNKNFVREFITFTNLKKERGWTNSLIDRFAGSPDRLEKNPNYKSGPPMKLYLIIRIENLEKTPEFQLAFAKLQKRKEGAKAGAAKATATKFKSTQLFVESVKINLPVYDRDKLIRHAIVHYNELQFIREKDNFATVKDDPDFLERLCVNYLRHELSSYEEELDCVKGKVGTHFAYGQIKDKVYAEIKKKYPWLENACNKQIKYHNNLL